MHKQVYVDSVSVFTRLCDSADLTLCFIAIYIPSDLKEHKNNLIPF